MRLPEAVAGAWRLLRVVLDRYAGDRGPLIAAAIAFFTLLSIVPFMLLGLAALGHFIGQEEARRQVHNTLSQFLQEPRVMLYLDEVARRQNAIAGIGLLALLWSAAQIFLNLEMALDLAWRAPTGRHFLQSRLLAFGMTLVAGALLLTSMAATSALAAIHEFARRRLPGQGASWTGGIAEELTPFLVTVVAFAVMYRVLPNTRVRWSAAWAGALTGGLMWEVAKRLLAYYLARLAHYEPVYGPVAALVALFLWAYYSAATLLLGAEFGALFQERIEATVSVRRGAPACGSRRKGRNR